MKYILPITLIVSILGYALSSFMFPHFAKGVLAKKKQLTAIRQQGENLPQLQTLLDTQKEKFDLLEGTFPKQEDLVSVVQSIDNLAGRLGVVAAFHFEKEQAIADPGGAYVYPIEITVEGDYSGCIAFINGLFKNKYLYVLKTIEGTSPTGIKSKNKIVIKGNLYAANK